MAYTPEEIKKIFENVCLRIIKGEAVRTILKDEDMPTMDTFWRWLRDNKDLSEQYVRAKELYAEGMFEDIILISDGSGDDLLIDEEGKENVNHHVIQRDRLRTDNRKWALSKLNPKKYGDKLDITSKDKAIKQPIFGSNPLHEQ